nr:site-specific DNA-methyltransferase [Actinomadura kijaniata]
MPEGGTANGCCQGGGTTRSTATARTPATCGTSRPGPCARRTSRRSPVDIPLRCIAAGCRPGGNVLDPFAGAGTTGLAARQLGRHFTGIELVPDYYDLIARRLAAAAGRDLPPEVPGD